VRDADASRDVAIRVRCPGIERNTMKARIVLTALALATAGAIFAPTAEAATAPFDRELGLEARYALDASKRVATGWPTTFVYARCYATEAAFEGAAWWRLGHPQPGFLIAYAIKGEHTVYLRPSTCRAAHRFMRKMETGTTRKATEAEVGAYATLLHEALHVQGIRNERTTECIANDSVRWSAARYSIRESEANRLTRMAFNVSRKMTARRYHSVSGECQYMLSGSGLDWADFLA
jgi:hypothetical protein